MSHHISTPGELFHRGRVEKGQKVRDVPRYLASIPLPSLHRLLFLDVAMLCLRKRPCLPRQKVWGKQFCRRRETINRAVASLKREGLIYVKRRGCRLSNVYLLARRIWRAITGQDPPYFRELQLALRFREGLESGKHPARAARDAVFR